MKKSKYLRITVFIQKTNSFKGSGMMNIKDLIRLLPKRELMLLLFFKIYLSAFNVFFSWMMQIALESVLEGFMGKQWLIASIGMIGGAITYILIDYFFKITLKQLFQSLTNSLSEIFIGHCLSNREFLANTDEGKFLAFFSNDLDIIGSYIEFGLIPLLDMGIMLLFGVFYVMIQSWQFGILFIGVALGVFMVNRKLSKALEENFGIYITKNDTFIQFIEQVYHLIPSFKFFNIHQWFFEKYTNYVNDRREAFNKYNTIYANLYTITEGMIKLMDILMLTVGLIFVSRGSLTLPVLIGVRNAGLGSILYPAGTLPELFRYYGQYRVSLERLSISISDEGSSIKLEDQELANPIVLPISLQIKQVNLSDDRTLRNIEAQLNPTGMTFIVGPSGAGKSSLIKILMGLNQNFEGNLFYGKQLFDPTHYRFGYAPQKNVLFRASLRDNLTLGDKSISDNQIVEICQKLNIWELIKGNSNELDAIYEPGHEWSNGQMRRLNIARALLLPSDMIILDEPFSDLDLENQHRVIKIMRELSVNKPVVLITHTFDFIRAEDYIIKVGDINVLG